MVMKNIGILYYQMPTNSNPKSVLYNNIQGVEELDGWARNSDLVQSGSQCTHSVSIRVEPSSFILVSFSDSLFHGSLLLQPEIIASRERERLAPQAIL
jgi:hypothetical protein